MSGFVFAENGAGLHFVGDFEGLYQAEADPWGQSGRSGEMAAYYAHSRHRLSEALGRLRSGYRGGGIEIGCGHGYTLQGLQKAFGGHWAGLDISKTAIARARELHPDFKFYDGDIANRDCLTPHHAGKYDAVILSQLLWYILDRFDAAASNALRLCAPGGLLVVTQAFLKSEQRYGSEIANGFPGALMLFLERFPSLTVVETAYDDSGRFVHNDGLLIFRKARNAE